MWGEVQLGAYLNVSTYDSVGGAASNYLTKGLRCEQ